MSAINLFAAPGQPGVDPKKQKALLVAWLLLSSNSLLSYTQTRIVKDDAGVAKAIQDGARPNSLVNYLDLRDIYPLLKPLAEKEVDALFALAKEKIEFSAVSSAYWDEGESMLRYSDHYCLAVQDVLSMNT